MGECVSPQNNKSECMKSYDCRQRLEGLDRLLLWVCVFMCYTKALLRVLKNRCTHTDHFPDSMRTDPFALLLFTLFKLPFLSRRYKFALFQNLVNCLWRQYFKSNGCFKTWRMRWAGSFFNLMLCRISLIHFSFDNDESLTFDLVLVRFCLCSPECDGGGDSECLQTSMPEAQLQTNPKSAQTDTGNKSTKTSWKVLLIVIKQ